MNKGTFLRLQYLRMINSDEFVVELWRSSLDRFVADMWDRTPTSPGRRFLSPVDPSLGFAPDNVEWRYPQVKSRTSNTKTKKGAFVKISPMRPTKAERQQIEASLRDRRIEEKRRAIAEEFVRWERQQSRLT